MSFQETLDRLSPPIEVELRQILRSPHHSLGAYYGMMHYHLGWSDEAMRPMEARTGKMIRPILGVLACEAAGGKIEQALPAAAAVELVHSFSLVHDDIQDQSHTRRGRRAVWDIWGGAHGINVGDGLFVLARLALYRAVDRGVSLDRILDASLTLDRACLGLCEGQYFDMSFEAQTEVDEDQYLWMIRHKTAALLSASTEIGARIATDSPAVIQGLAAFGEHLGMAFQIEDDILGAWGDEDKTGKSAATDIRDKKKTLPVVYTMSQLAYRGESERLTNIYRTRGPIQDNDIETALALMESVGAKVYAEEKAASFHKKATESLAQTGLALERLKALREVAGALLGRTT